MILENLLNVCCLNLDVLNAVDQPFILLIEPVNISPTNKLDDDKFGGDTQIEKVLHEMAERILKRGLVILISDLNITFQSNY